MCSLSLRQAALQAAHDAIEAANELINRVAFAPNIHPIGEDADRLLEQLSAVVDELTVYLTYEVSDEG